MTIPHTRILSRSLKNRIIWHADDFYTKLGDWEAAWVASTEPIELPEVEPDYVFEMIDRYKDTI